MLAGLFAACCGAPLSTLPIRKPMLRGRHLVVLRWCSDVGRRPSTIADVPGRRCLMDLKLITGVRADRADQGGRNAPRLDGWPGRQHGTRVTRMSAAEPTTDQ